MRTRDQMLRKLGKWVMSVRGQLQRNWTNLLTGMLGALCPMAYSAEAVDDPSSSQLHSSVDFVAVDPQLKNYGIVDWSTRWDRGRISVCWMDQKGFKQERDWVRQAVNDSWSKANPQVVFVNWDDCGQAERDVHISVGDFVPRSYLGNSVTTHRPSMFLNFTFKTWSHDCVRKKEQCIRATAIHEFGHTLGFEHEQLQPDAPQGCIAKLKAEGQWETIGGAPSPVTPYDADSIMNYCNAIWLNSGTLSNNDIKALRIMFPY